MKFSHFLALAATAAVTATVTWQFSASRHRPQGPAAETAPGRKLKYYQSPMHPWITSPTPGTCTVCGMNLVAVYEGDSGFTSEDGTVSLSTNAVQLLGVKTSQASRRPLKRSLRVAGVIEDDDTRHRFISAYVDGRLDRLRVNFVGAEVEAGQPLASLYSPTLLNAEREYTLLARSTRAGEETPRLIQAARQRLRRLGLSEAEIDRVPQKSEADATSPILAPISGTVVQRFVYEGQYVKEGDKLFEMADFSTMWFKFDAYERDLPWLKTGQKVEITTPSLPGKVIEAEIKFLDPNLNDATRSLKARVEIPNPPVAEGNQRALRHRLYAEAVVRIEIPETLAVPRSAVLASGPQAVVYVELNPGHYEARKVKLGRAGDDDWEILEGLDASEKVVVQGNLMIDAQAQLNQIVKGSTDAASASSTLATNTASASPPPLDAATLGKLGPFVDLIASLGTALAGDDLNAFNTLAAAGRPRLHEAAGLFQSQPGWETLAAPLHLSDDSSQAPDLKSARKTFHALSTVAVSATRAGKGTGPFAGLKIYQCPMVKNAFPGAPKSGAWVQLSGPLRNPYFGAEMLDCGSEVAP